ncbi:hypothetical protein KA005_30470, partial [bacterium]|nr:hypothetical protein [bacterium]
MTSVKIYIDYGSGNIWQKTEDTVPGSADSWVYDDKDIAVNGVGSYVHENATLMIEDFDAARGAYTQYISNAFNIAGKFTIDDTVLPATLSAGSNYTIKWDNHGLQGPIPKAKLEFFDGEHWHNYDYKGTDTGEVSNLGGEQSWSVPTDVKSVACQFRISDIDNPEAVDLSAAFEIRAVITVDSPVSADKWTIGTSGNNIDWTVTGLIGEVGARNVKIEYSADAGSNYPVAFVIVSSIADTSTYPWTIPTNLNILTLNEAMIKVSDASLAVVYGESAPFMMKSGITVTSPNTNDILTVLDAGTFDIEWTTLGTADMGDVAIEFYKQGYSEWLHVDTVAFNYNNGVYSSWFPPIDSITSDAKTAKIRITDVDNTEVTNESDLFEIEGKILLNEPAGSDFVWQRGATNHDIKWTPTGTFSLVKVEYSTNAFATEAETHYYDIVANSAHNTQKTWGELTVPDAISNTVAFRISDNADSDVNYISGTFKIADIEITYPTGSPLWICDTDQHVDYKISGSITQIDIEYYTAGTGWKPIGTNPYATGPQEEPYVLNFSVPKDT